MDLETEETCKMVVEVAGGVAQYTEDEQETREPCISEEETIIELNNDGTTDASAFEGKENNDELRNRFHLCNNRDVDPKESEEEAGNQEKDALNVVLDKQEFTAAFDRKNNEAGLASKVGDEEMLIGSEDDTDTTKEMFSFPKKKVLKGKKVVKKRKLVKGKGILAKDEEKSQPSDTSGPSVEVRPNLDAKTDESLAGFFLNDSLIDKQEVAASVDLQKDEEGFACEVGDDDIFIVPEDDISEENVLRSENAKDLESAFTMKKNKKEKIINDDTNTTNDMMLPQKKVLRRNKVVKKRILVKGKAVVTKDEEKPQSLDMPDRSVEVRPNQHPQNEESLDGINNVNNSSTVKTKQKKAQQKIAKVSVESKQTEKNKQDGKEKTTLESEKMDGMNEEAKLQGVTAEDKDGAEPSNKPNSSNKVETMGMIFMCSSKTKEDCYRYKIMGLPASKKDAVLKVYKGMRLFLFDFELKLLYGIYKAAGPGGYNIEPNAFKSNFPSQVRFTAVRDCSPLPEEKFKNVIKDNYYTKNKFNTELTAEQVKSLCKLFQLGNKGSSKSKAKAVSERARARVHPAVVREKKRRVRMDNDERGRERRVVADAHADGDAGRDNKRRRIVVDNVNQSRGRDAAAGNVRGSGGARSSGAVVRPRGAEDGARRRSRVEDADARRSSLLEDDARRRLRMEDEQRRRVWADDDAARRVLYEDDARLRLRLETEERLRLRMEEDARHVRAAAHRRHSPLGLPLNDSITYLRHSAADVYRREAYLPSTALPLLHMDAYTASYSGTGGTSSLGDYRVDMGMSIGNEDRGVAPYSRPRHLYDYETTPYMPMPSSRGEQQPIIYHRDHPGYDVSSSRNYYPSIASRDEYLGSPSRMSRYGLSPHRRY